MQAFSNRLFYNRETGYFEQVQSHMVCWDGNITPSSSLSTLYLPEEAIGAVSQRTNKLALTLIINTE